MAETRALKRRIERLKARDTSELRTFIELLTTDEKVLCVTALRAVGLPRPGG